MGLRAAIWLGFLAWAFFWVLALLVAFNDIDFFTFQDLFDTTALHHEHFVAAFVILGPVVAVFSLIFARLTSGHPESSLETRG